MSKFIDKVKAIIEKIKVAIDKFAQTKVGKPIMKFAAMIGTLLILGGIICSIVLICTNQVGLVSGVAVAIVCASAIDELVKCIKYIIQ